MPYTVDMIPVCFSLALLALPAPSPADGVKEDLKQAGRQIGQAAKKGGKALGRGAKTAGKGIAKGAKEAGRGIKEAVK